MKGAELLSKHTIFILQIEDRSGGAGLEQSSRRSEGRGSVARGGVKRTSRREYQGPRRGRIGRRRRRRWRRRRRKDGRRRRGSSGRRRNRIDRTNTTGRKPTKGWIRSGWQWRRVLVLWRVTDKLCFFGVTESEGTPTD